MDVDNYHAIAIPEEINRENGPVSQHCRDHQSRVSMRGVVFQQTYRNGNSHSWRRKYVFKTALRGQFNLDVFQR